MNVRGERRRSGEQRNRLEVPLARLGELRDERRGMLPAAAAARACTGLLAHRGRIAMTGIDGAFDVLVGDCPAETNVHLAQTPMRRMTGSDSK